MPYDFKVEWVNSENIDSSLEEGTLIVKMKNHKNQSKNFAIAVWEYVRHGLIPVARKYVDPNLMTSVDYVISKDIIYESKDTRALTFMQSFPEIREHLEDDYKKKLVSKVDEIHKSGYLLRVVLPEFNSLSRFAPIEPTEDMYLETKELVEIVYRLITKSPGENVNPTMNGEFIKAAIVPVAKTETVRRAGTLPHYTFINKCLLDGISTFYIVARGENAKYAYHIVNMTTRALKLRKVFEDIYEVTYKGKNKNLLCKIRKIKEYVY